MNSLALLKVHMLKLRIKYKQTGDGNVEENDSKVMFYESKQTTLYKTVHKRSN